MKKKDTVNGSDGMSKIRLGITVLIILLILKVISVVVCAAPYEAEYKKVITVNDNGKTMDIKQGDIVYLRLKENPSTGYSWQLSLSEGLSLLNTKYCPPKSPKGGQRLIVGAAGFHSWKIKAVAKGSQQIKGIYKRSWKKETGQEHTFILYVRGI